MFKHELHGKEGLLIVSVDGPLRAEDFAALAAHVDPHIEEHGVLQGLMIVVPSFPDWDSFTALLSHFRFVRDHHERIRRVAIVSDNREIEALEGIAKHFVDAEVRHFHLDEQREARIWLVRHDDT